MGAKHVIADKDSEMGMRHRPTISLRQSELPEMKDWKVKGKYKLEIEVEMTSIGSDEWEKTKPIRGSFSVTSVKDITDKSAKDMSKGEFNKAYVKARSGE